MAGWLCIAMLQTSRLRQTQTNELWQLRSETRRLAAEWGVLRAGRAEAPRVFVAGGPTNSLSSFRPLSKRSAAHRPRASPREPFLRQPTPQLTCSHSSGTPQTPSSILRRETAEFSFFCWVAPSTSKIPPSIAPCPIAISIHYRTTTLAGCACPPSQPASRDPPALLQSQLPVPAPVPVPGFQPSCLRNHLHTTPDTPSPSSLPLVHAQHRACPPPSNNTLRSFLPSSLAAAGPPLRRWTGRPPPAVLVRSTTSSRPGRHPSAHLIPTTATTITTTATTTTIVTTQHALLVAVAAMAGGHGAACRLRRAHDPVEVAQPVHAELGLLC